MKWTTKALIQRVLSRMPGGKHFYYLGQRYLYGFQKFNIEPKVQQGITIIKCLSAVGETIEGKNIFEIGTGWSPVIPLFFWLLGYEKCFTFDITKLLKESLVIESVRQLKNIASLPNKVLDQSLINLIKTERINKTQLLEKENAHQILENCNISYCAPRNTSSTGLPTETLDLVYSNVVLEHIPEHEIRDIFSEMFRILRPGGHMVHHIDLGDHFSHSDSAISSINFLQFSDGSFTKYNSHFLFQNRLRISEYKKLLLESGFSIVHEEKCINERAMQQLSTLRIHGDFSKYTTEELCTTNYKVVAKR